MYIKVKAQIENVFIFQLNFRFFNNENIETKNTYTHTEKNKVPKTYCIGNLNK